MPPLSPAILSIIAPFAILFSSPVWNNAITLFIGALLCRGKRTVCAALRVMGLGQATNFAKYHHVLNRADWSLLSASRILLNLIVRIVGKDNPVNLFIDETLERRKGPKIKAKGYYRDAVRSSKKTVVKSSGLKWLTLALSWRFPFSERYFALPFMTVLEPSAKSDKAAKKKHKTTLQWTIQMIIQVGRWLKYTPINVIGDGGFACGELAWLCLKLKIGLITRLKMNARLYDFPPTAWYEKKDATFSDLLTTVRKVLWKDNLISRKHILESFRENNKGLDEVIGVGSDKIPPEISWIGLLIEHLAA